MKAAALQQAIYDALITPIGSPSYSWVELTEGDADFVTFQNVGYAPVFIKATSSSSPPTDAQGSLEFPAASQAVSYSISSMFPGIAGANRLWAYAWFDGAVAISHAPSTNKTVTVSGSPSGSDLVALLAQDFYDPLYPIFSIGSVPQAADSESDAAFPYITFYAPAITPFDSKDKVGGSAIVQIDVWARTLSDLAVNQIGDAVDARIRRQPLSITGATHITSELITSDLMGDPDGKTKHFMAQYRVLWITT
jgi:hypothetical protein